MATQPVFVTAEEYLAEEERSAIRHEYWNGSVVAMAGADPTHNDIVRNLTMIIGGQLRHSGCYVRSSDQRVRTAPQGLYSYPDLVISCKSQLDRTTLLNPCALIEVLSESTQDYDRGSKFERYRNISSFQDYICVAQDRIYVEHHRRESAGSDIWTLREYRQLQDEFGFVLPEGKSLTFPVADIYDDLEFGQPPL